MTDHFLKEEQEVIIHFNPVEETASVYCADPAWIRKMDKLTESNPEQFKCVKVDHYTDGTVCSKNYVMPKRFLTVRTKDIHITMTDEQRQAASERMKEMHRTHRINFTASEQ